MATVLQLTRRLEERPVTVVPPGIVVRTFDPKWDVEAWLELRRKAFARQAMGVRDWNAGDFAAQLLSQPWWRPENSWLAEERGPLGASAPCVVGTVTLARRGQPPAWKPAVHWLMVAPRHRRSGVARMLLSTLEAACWDAGERQVWLETHAAWSEAAAFYQSVGYIRA